MKFATKEQAWEAANTIFPTDYALDAESSERAGYPVYRSTAEGHWYDHISDLNARLEVNIGSKTVNLWIDAAQEEEPDVPEEGYVRIETTAVKTGEIRKYPNYSAFLKDYRFFCAGDCESAEREFETIMQTMQRLQNTGASFSVTRGDLNIRFTYTTYKDGGAELGRQLDAAGQLGQRVYCLYTHENYTEYNLVVDGDYWNHDETEHTVYDALKNGENGMTVGMELIESYLNARGIKWGTIRDVRLNWYDHSGNGGHFIVSAYVETD